MLSRNCHELRRFIGVWAVSILVTLCSTAGWGQTASLETIIDEIETVTDLALEMERAVDRVNTDNAQLQARLDVEDEELTSATIKPEMLQTARFDVDTSESRLATVDNRIAQRRETLQERDSQLSNLEGEIAALPPEALSTYVGEIELELTRELREQQAALLAVLEEYRGAVQQNLSLAQERLALLRSRISLAAVEDTEGFEADPRVASLRTIVDRLVQDSIRLGNAAAAIEPTGQADLERKRILEIESDEALMRSTARLGDVEILRAEHRLDNFDEILSDPSMPLRLLQQVRGDIGDITQRLEARAAVVAEEQTDLRDRRRIIRQQSLEESAALTGLFHKLDGLTQLLQFQAADLEQVSARAAALAERYDSVIGARESQLLQVRQTLPTDAASLERVQASLMLLPDQFMLTITSFGRELWGRIRALPQEGRIILGAILAGVLIIALLLRQVFFRRYVQAGPERLTAIPVEVLRRNILALLPALLWLTAALYLGFGQGTTMLVLAVLGVVPVLKLILDLTRGLVVERASGRRREVGRRFLRLMRGALFLVAIVMLVFILSRAVPMLPSTESLIDRTVFLCLIFIAIPALMLRSLIMAGDGDGHTGVGAMTIAFLSLIIPLGFLAAGVIGAAGWINLGWRIASYIAWFIAIGGALALVVAIARDMTTAYEHRLEARHPDWAGFWEQNFVEPAFRLATLALIFGAAWLLFRIFGWTGETPIIRDIVDLAYMPVITLGESTLSVGGILLALLLVALVFWIGGWSRNVSYNLAYNRVSDSGVRQSLSTFTQYLVIVGGVLLTLLLIGFDLTTLTVFAASLGVGIGFGLQNIVNNFVSGVLVLAERPLRIGDRVTVGDNTGWVTRIGIRSLTIRTDDSAEVIIPNASVISEIFMNMTKTDDLFRDVIHLGISYDDDPRRAVLVIKQALRDYDEIVGDPEPIVGIWEFGDSTIVIRIECYFDLRNPVGDTQIHFDTMNHILEALDRAGISMPNPQYDLNVIGRGGGGMALVDFASADRKQSIKPSAA